MSQELFQQILSDLRKCQPTDKPYALLYAIKSAVPALVTAGKSCTCSDVIKVMESGIFRDGGLKKEPSGNYPFKDLALFIWKASCYVFRPFLEEIFRDSISAFDEVIKEMDNLKFAAKAYRSKVSIKKLNRIEQDLKDIKSDLLSKPQRKLGFRLPKKWREKPDRIDYLISLFKEQLPDEAKDYNSAGAIQTLLRLSGNHVSQEAIAQRMYRWNEIKQMNYSL